MTYKFTRVYLVEEKTEAEAFKRCKDEPLKYLTFSSVAVESSGVLPGWCAIATCASTMSARCRRVRLSSRWRSSACWSGGS